MKQKFKSYNFWISLTSVIVLFVRLIGAKFGITISEDEFMDLMVVLCTIFAILGIFEVPKATNTSQTNQTLIERINSSIEQVKTYMSNTYDTTNLTKEGEEKMQNDIENIEKSTNNVQNLANEVQNVENVIETEPVLDEDNAETFAQTEKVEAVVINITNNNDIFNKVPTNPEITITEAEVAPAITEVAPVETITLEQNENVTENANINTTEEDEIELFAETVEVEPEKTTENQPIIEVEEL